MTKSKKEISSNDRKILDALMRNARQPSIELSKKTRVSRQTVQKTIRKLETEHVIWGYQVIVDEQKKGFSHFLVLIKRSIKPIDEKLVDKDIGEKIEKKALNIGVKIETSLYCHGSYDWIISIMATDITHAKKFTEQIKTIYGEYIAEVQLLDILFFVKKQGILNPDVDKLKEFV